MSFLWAHTPRPTQNGLDSSVEKRWHTVIQVMDLPWIEMHKQRLFSGWKLEDPLIVYVSYAHQAALI